MRLNLVWIRHRHNWCGRTVQTEGVRDDVYEPPERYHHDEGDDAPKNELMTLRDFFWFAMRENVGLGDAIKKHNECDSEEHRHQDVIDSVDNERAGVREIVDCGERDERQSERGESSDGKSPRCIATPASFNAVRKCSRWRRLTVPRVEP